MGTYFSQACTMNAYLIDAVGSSRILIGKQKLGLTFNSDKLGQEEEAQAIVPASTGQHRHCTWSVLKIKIVNF